jgi:hypothetical protein
MTFSRIDPFTAMRGPPVLFTALAEKDLDQIVKPVLRILHAAQELVGPRTVSVRSGSDGSLILWVFRQSGLFVCAASRDGSRSKPELAAALHGAQDWTRFFGRS